MLELITQYSYDPASPNRIYFPIGSAVTAIAIILAFTQIARPIVRFRLATGFFKPIIAYVLFVLAIIFVFVAAILPFVPGPALPLLGYPVFWEILAGLLFVLASLSFLWSVNRRAKFGKRNCKRYLDYCVSLIATGSEQDLRELASEIFDSVGEIVKCCKEYSSPNSHSGEQGGKTSTIPERTRYALMLLDIWSDGIFCHMMVCHVPHTAIEIFRQITEQKLYHLGGHSLVDQLVRQALADKTSILYREEDFYGLGHFKTFTNTVFGNSELIDSSFRPLQAWSHWEDPDVLPWKIEKYCDVVNIATRAHITSRWRGGYPSGLLCGFERLTEIAMSEAIKLDKLSDDEAYDSVHFRSLSIIASGLKKAVKTLVEHEKDIPDYGFSDDGYDRFEDTSVYGVVAQAVYAFLEALSVAHSKDEEVRMIAISLWMDIYPVSKSWESKAVIELQRRLNIHLFKKVKENLEELWYPMLTRVLLNLYALELPTPSAEQCGDGLFRMGFFELLRKHYEKAVSRDTKKAKDMLPKSVKYDGAKGCLIKEHPSGSTSVLDLR